METKVLTQEELQSLKAIQEKRIQLTEQFGIIEMRIQEIGLQEHLSPTRSNGLVSMIKKIKLLALSALA
jgi:sulfur transfer protein SufE